MVSTRTLCHFVGLQSGSGLCVHFETAERVWLIYWEGHLLKTCSMAWCNINKIYSKYYSCLCIKTEQYFRILIDRVESLCAFCRIPQYTQCTLLQGNKSDISDAVFEISGVCMKGRSASILLWTSSLASAVLIRNNMGVMLVMIL